MSSSQEPDLNKSANPGDVPSTPDRTIPAGEWKSPSRARKVEQNESYPSIQAGPFLTRQMVGSYRILGFLGRGGMGFVYRVEHTVMQKEMALKVLSQSGTTSQWRRFQTEAQAIARLDHPNIVKIYDMGQSEDGQPYYTMDLLLGQSLADYIISRGRLPLEEALPIFRQVASGLAYAHDHGIIHRDIKPANIMLLAGKAEKSNQRAAPVVKIVDFGIAKLTDQDNEVQGVTKPGEIFGSPIYMSPEQCSGQKVDYRTDMYSLGVAFYEALVGKPPFVGRTAVETTAMHQTKMAPSLKDGLPEGSAIDFPVEIEDMVAKLMAKNPQWRYKSLAEMANELLHLERGPNAVTAKPSNWSIKDINELRQMPPEPVPGDVQKTGGDKNRLDKTLKDRNDWTHSRRKAPITVCPGESSPEARDKEQDAADQEQDWDSQEVDLDSPLMQSSVRRPSRNTRKNSAATAKTQDKKNHGTSSQGKLVFTIVAVMLILGTVSAFGIYKYTQSRSYKGNGADSAGTINWDGVSKKLGQKDNDLLLQSIGKVEESEKDTAEQLAAVKRELGNKQPFSTRLAKNGQYLRVYKFPREFSLGEITWQKHEPADARDQVVIPEGRKTQFKPNLRMVRYPEFLRRFRPDDISWYGQDNRTKSPAGTLDIIANWTALEHLEFSHAVLTNEELDKLNKMNSVRWFTLNHCDYDRNHLASMKLVQKLRVLELSDKIDASLLNRLANCKSLNSLVFYQADLDSKAAAALAKMQSVRFVRMERCTVGPGVFQEIAKMPNLNRIYIISSHDTTLAAVSPLKNSTSISSMIFDFMDVQDDNKPGTTSAQGSDSGSDSISNHFPELGWKPEDISTLRRLMPNTVFKKVGDDGHSETLLPINRSAIGNAKFWEAIDNPK